MNFLEQIIEYLTYLKPYEIINEWEEGLKVTLGKCGKVCRTGIFLKIPFIDEFYVQPVRERVVGMPLQSLTSLDGKDICIKGALTYKIIDIKKLYTEVHAPETTIINIASDAICSFCMKNSYEQSMNDKKEFLANLKEYVNKILDELDYGISFYEFKVTAFSSVKTYRLIQDQHWDHGIDDDII